MTSPPTNRVWPMATRTQGNRSSGRCQRRATAIATGADSAIALNTGPARAPGMNRKAPSTAHPTSRYTSQILDFGRCSSVVDPISSSSRLAHGRLRRGELPVLLVLELEPLVQLAEHAAERVDLLVVVGGRDLDPEADLVLRDEWVRGHGDVDPAVEEVAAHRVDVPVVGEGDLDQRVARTVRRVDAESMQ